jgi:murein DD-endopeptidase MepM/ murein hydrolase activator NlpD
MRSALAVFVVSTLMPAHHMGPIACWSPPVPAAVAEPFRQPECRWCPGNRGIEFATAPGDPVRAAAAGTVTFAGSVAGTTYVVVRHPDGLRLTYGNLVEARWQVGDTVVAGVVIGDAAGHLHFGVRRGDDYVDPSPMLGEQVGVRRLIPTDGAAAPPAPAAVLRCPVLADVSDG